MVVGVVVVVVVAESGSEKRFGRMRSLISAVAPAGKATVPAGFTLTALEPPKACEASRDVPPVTMTMSTTTSLRDKSVSSVGV
jgi:hypothetical protein